MIHHFSTAVNILQMSKHVVLMSMLSKGSSVHVTSCVVQRFWPHTFDYLKTLEILDQEAKTFKHHTKTLSFEVSLEFVKKTSHNDSQWIIISGQLQELERSLSAATSLHLSQIVQGKTLEAPRQPPDTQHFGQSAPGRDNRETYEKHFCSTSSRSCTRPAMALLVRPHWTPAPTKRYL